MSSKWGALGITCSNTFVRACTCESSLGDWRWNTVTHLMKLRRRQQNRAKIDVRPYARNKACGYHRSNSYDPRG